MKIEEIELLESEFDIEFPDVYRETLLNYPLSYVAEEIINSLDVLTEKNREIRENGFWGVDVPNSFWLIGLDGMGGGDFIDTSTEETYVHIFDHATPPKDMYDKGQLRPKLYSEHISEFIEEDQQAIEEEETRKEELRRAVENRRWWQFWIPEK